MAGWLMNDELERISKETCHGLNDAAYQHLPGETKKKKNHGLHTHTFNIVIQIVVKEV
jgi:hypothetical protein